MIDIRNLIRLSDVLWEVPRTYRADMRVPARFLASESMLDDVLKDRSINQLVNVATLPGIVKAAYAMPDVHEGYGFPIGGVAATECPHGVISPGGIGYDINCGVRLLTSNLVYDDIKDRLESLSRELYSWVPSGVGRGGQITLSDSDLQEVLSRGASWAVKHGYAYSADIDHIESRGFLPQADPAAVSDRAKKRGRDQIGTLGAGNHFVEVGVVDAIYDHDVAKAFNLSEKQMTVLIHTGSRGLGHQVATDYIRTMVKVMSNYAIHLPDRELACVPFNSPEGTAYFKAMCAAANFAWVNRQVITWEVRKAWEREFGFSGGKLALLYDVAHNMAKLENHVIDGEDKKLIVHRKGATRSFGPHAADLAGIFQKTGQPVLIPGSMGTASYVLVGTSEGMKEAFGSTCHGAGRVMSRRAAKKSIVGKQLREELKERGIWVQAGSVSGLSEEAPQAYKDIDEVVDVVCKAGVAKKVARLRPCAVIKG